MQLVGGPLQFPHDTDRIRAVAVSSKAEIRVGKIVPNAQQRLIGQLGRGIGHAIAKVQGGPPINTGTVRLSELCPEQRSARILIAESMPYYRAGIKS